MSGSMEATMFPYAIGLISVLFGCLVGVIGWAGSQIKQQIKDLGDKMEVTNSTLTKIERDLRGELTNLDRRITRVESKCENMHNGGGGE